MTRREQQILALIQADPLLSQQEIAKSLGISRSSVAGHIMNLTKKGAIKGRGYVFSDAPFIVVIGGANMDIHGSPSKKLRMNDSNPGTVITSPGGVARNVAENLARLGSDSRLISAVGNDQYGKMLLQQGRQAGIDMRNVVTMESAPTSTYLSILDHSGDMHVGISDMTIMDELGPDQLRSREAALKQAALIVLDTNLADDALAWLTATFSDRVLFVDTVSTTKALKIKPHLNAVHTLKPGLTEAEAIAGMKANSNRQLPRLADWFHDKGVQRLFISLGDKGVFYSAHDKQGIAIMPPISKHPKNAGGAGDAFLAGLAYSWIQGWSLEKTVQFGLAAASIAMSHRMTNNPDLSLATVNRIIENQYAE
jgi:pseudouridine kinase